MDKVEGSGLVVKEPGVLVIVEEVSTLTAVDKDVFKAAVVATGDGEVLRSDWAVINVKTLMPDVAMGDFPTVQLLVKKPLSGSYYKSQAEFFFKPWR